MKQGNFTDAPLGLLFPSIESPDEARLRAAAAAVDAVRGPGGRTTWHWAPEPSQVMVCTAVSADDRPGDWTELQLDICSTTTGFYEVTAQLGIACLCPADHGTHYVERFSQEVGCGRSLAEAFERAAHQVVRWTSAPSDPSFWRTRAGLPR
ncbi:hypothetical protein OG216_34895 [Streptomycetaceae bacterium NBC_01309]